MALWEGSLGCLPVRGCAKVEQLAGTAARALLSGPATTKKNALRARRQTGEARARWTAATLSENGKLAAPLPCRPSPNHCHRCRRPSPTVPPAAAAKMRLLLLLLLALLATARASDSDAEAEELVSSEGAWQGGPRCTCCCAQRQHPQPV